MPSARVPAWLALALAALPAGALQLVSPPALLVGEPCRLAWPLTGVTQLAGTVVSAGVELPFGPYDVASGAWELAGLPLGTHLIRAELRAGGAVETGEWTVAVLPALSLDRARLQRRLPHLAAAWAAGRTGRVLLLADDGFRAAGLTTDRILAGLLPRLGGGELQVQAPPTPDLPGLAPARAVGRWLTAARPDLVLVAARVDRLGCPPEVQVDLLAATADAVTEAGADLLLVTPAATALADLGPALAAADELAAQVGERAWVLSAVPALWPAEPAGAEALAVGLAQAVAEDGVWTPEGHRRLAAAILRELAEPAAVEPMVLLRARLSAPPDPEVRLEVSSAAAAECEAELLIFDPAGLLALEGLPLALPAGGSRALTRRWDERWPARLLAALLGGGEAGLPVTVECRSDGLAARFEPGRMPLAADPVAALRVTNGRARALAGVVSGTPGTPAQLFRVAARGVAVVPVGVPLPGRGTGRVPLAVEARAEDDRASAGAGVGYAYAVEVGAGPAQVDGDLAEWAAERWYALERPGQVVTTVGWSGPADAAVRFALRYDSSALYLAFVRTDDAFTADDALELWWDPRPAAELGRPGTTRRLRLTGAGAPDGDAADGTTVVDATDGATGEARLAWPALGVARPVAGRVFGFDLVCRDADPGGAPSLMVYSGERWGDLDPVRLGLARLAGSSEPSPVRLLVAPR